MLLTRAVIVVLLFGLASGQSDASPLRLPIAQLKKPTALGVSASSVKPAPPAMPDPVKKLIEEGDALTKQENYREALARYQTAINLASPTQRPSLLLAIGICHAQLLQLEEAERSCDQFQKSTPSPSAQDQAQLEICRSQITARRSILKGDTARAAKDFPTARAEYQAAYLFTQSPDLLREIADCYKEERSWQNMLEQCDRYENAITNPNDAVLHYIKSCRAMGTYELAKEQCYDLVNNHQYNEALKTCQSVLEIKQSLGVLLRVGLAYAQLKQFREAQSACERYSVESQQTTRNAEATTLLSDCQRLVREGLAPAVVVVPSALPEKPPPWYKKKWVWAVIGTAVISTGLATGLGIGLSRKSVDPFMDITIRPSSQ